ncbi:hypothetical protein J4420_04095 [Candidatus Woesearchaeota archaeon]|nr:hypothetical protein [Candidatus Woesearchaeota archaeon]
MIKDKIDIPAIREYRMAFEEYFKDKAKPKNDTERKKQIEEFMYGSRIYWRVFGTENASYYY